MKKDGIKGFVSGVLAASVIMGAGVALATTGQKSILADYSDIKVTMNGQAVELVDANGNAVEPFAISGTTYLPVRAVANALGLDVGWDGATSTVKLTSKTKTPTGTLIVDQSDIKVYYNGITQESSLSPGFNSYKINLTIENNTDGTVQMRADELSIDDYMVDISSSITEVAPGKKSNETITIYQYAMDDAGVSGPITGAEFKLSVYRVGEYGPLFVTDVIKL